MKSKLSSRTARFVPHCRQWLAALVAIVAALLGRVTPAPAAEEALPLESDAGEADSQTSLTRTVHEYAIPAGTLKEVMEAIHTATGITIQVQAGAETLPSPGVRGVLSVEEAFTKALAGTSMTANFVSSTSVILELRGEGQSVTVSEAIQLPSPKYTAPLRDLPQTLTVIPQSVIQTTGSVSLVEALRTVPGITLGAGEGGNPVGDRPFIRGADSQASTFVDGMRDIGAQSREVFNLESIEVSKGASGTNGGRGTAGGSLNLNSKTARPETFVAASFSPGTADFYRGTVDLNTKLTETIAFRLNALGHTAGVAGRDAVHSRRGGFSPTLAMGLGRPTRAYFTYFHLTSDDMPDTGIPYSNPVFVPRTDGIARILDAGDGSPLTNVDRNTFYGLKNRDFRDERVKTGTARLERDLTARVTVRNLTRYSRSNQDYIWTQPDDSKGNIYYGLLWRRTNNRISDVDTVANQTDLYGTGQTGSIRHAFATGAEFSRERGENDAYTIATGSNVCPSGAGSASSFNCTDLFHPDYNDPWTGSITRNNNPTNSQTGTKAVYAFDTMTLLPKLEATVGFRLDSYKASFISARAAGTDIRSAFKRDDTLFNYRAGLVYKPVVAGSIYVSYNTSSTPTGNALAQGSDPSALSSVVNANLEPEKNKSVEGGVKWEVFGGRMLLTGAVYRLNTENSRITLQDGTVAMAGKKRVDGLELGLAGRVTRKWQLFGGYSLMDAVLVRNGGNGAAFGLQDGATFPNTPRHSFSLTTNYEVTRRFTAGLGLYAMSRVWGSEPNNKWVPSYARTDLFASYQLAENMSLMFNAQNLFDVIYYDRAYPTHYASIAPGRSARVTFNVRF